MSDADRRAIVAKVDEIRVNPTKDFMIATPNGKIGRLPKALQDEVNRRLENGQKSRLLAAWLNSLPEVQAMLATEFAGKPIREENLSEWRKHGYQQWFGRRQAIAMAQTMASTAHQLSSDQVAAWVTVQYLLAIRKLTKNNVTGQPD